MKGLAARLLPFALSFFSSLCIMILELVASRLVARHVGGSLIVWTTVIGVMLGGICLGNVLGGRLADRIEPRRAIGPLYALGAALTLACLWMNAALGLLTPAIDYLPWDLRTVLVVTLDFLVPTTVLGMIGPVVAKMAVERSRKAGTAIGLVYFMGAVGSIVGTFIAGFYLIYLAPTSTIVAVVAAALVLLAGLFFNHVRGALVGLVAAAALGVGATLTMTRETPLPGIRLGSVPIDVVSLVGHALTLLLAVMAWIRLNRETSVSTEEAEAGPDPTSFRPGRLLGRMIGRKPAMDVLQDRLDLTDLAALSFVASLAFMALEMVAGRLVTRHLGSSVYGWTSIIGVMLGGLSLGNFLGGLIANHVRRESQASWLFLFASVFTAMILLAETPPRWLIRNPIGHWGRGEVAIPLMGPDATSSWLSEPVTMTGYPWWFRVLFWVAVVFLLPSAAMGTLSPVLAKLAVERARRLKRTGSAIGQVYAWGMVGSILGTFLTGFLLIDVIGSKGTLLVLAAVLALAATSLGTIWHAAWAGIPMGLCLIALVPLPWFEKQGVSWGLREPRGNVETDEDEIAYIDESKYYYIKVNNESDPEGKKRTLVLDNLIHGYYVLGHPERLDYDYEHIYALVTRRVAEAKAKAEGLTNPVRAPLNSLFLGGGSYTFPRYLQHLYPSVAAEVAEIDPAVTRANHLAMGLPLDTPITTTWGDARQFVVNNQRKKFDLIFGDAFNDFSVPWHLTTREFNEMLANMLTPAGVYMINIIDVYESDVVAAERGRDKAQEEARAAALARGEKDLDAAQPTEEAVRQAVAEAQAEARKLGGFLGSWVNTARLTFDHIYVFGTDEEPGTGLRETFVVVASKAPIDLADLGGREDDPRFFTSGKLFEPKPYPPSDMEALRVRSRGIVLTDDYAPVENLLAPVAATRGDD